MTATKAPHENTEPMTLATGRSSDKFMLRLPAGMRNQLKEQATQNSRSLNAEIVARLQASFAHEGERTFTMTHRQFKAALREAMTTVFRERDPNYVLPDEETEE